MRGAITIISVVLLTGIILGLIGVAYAWGVPMIEKGTTVSSYRSAESFIKELDSTIVEMANSGSGSRTIDIPVGGLMLVPNSTAGANNNSLILDLEVSQPMAFETSLVPIETASLADPASYGTDRPRTITLSAQPSPAGYLLTLKLRYRSLESGTKGYKIVLRGSENDRGTSKATVSFGGTEVISGGCCDQAGDLTVTYIDVNLS